LTTGTTKTGKTRKKPVETKENPLTSRLEKVIVNCGTFFRTRINTGDFAIHILAKGRRRQSGGSEPPPTKATRST
jgi:hypothetical protein